MKSNAPRVLKAGMSGTRLVMFADASLESDDRLGRIGLMAFLVANNAVVSKFYFSEVVLEDVMGKRQARTPKIISTLGSHCGSLFIMR